MLAGKHGVHPQGVGLGRPQQGTRVWATAAADNWHRGQLFQQRWLIVAGCIRAQPHNTAAAAILPAVL